MTLSQNDMGRSFEYGIVEGLAQLLHAQHEFNDQLLIAKRCFEKCSNKEKEKIVKAAGEVASFLSVQDNRLTDRDCTIFVQSDQIGELGDVRDIIVHNAVLKEEIGISAKNRHFALKHSRLSDHIDFGFDWLGIHCSPTYFYTVIPIFNELRIRHRRLEHWKDIQDKVQRYYLPILQSFQTELERLSNEQPQETARRLIQYLLGKFDYYKVIKENGNVSIISINLFGTLRWGSRLPLPSSIIQISQKPRSNNTLFVFFDQGWQISLRIHSATTVVEPSLKFDIQPVGFPSQMSRHVIPYG